MIQLYTNTKSIIMRHKIITLLLAVVASAGMYAERVQIGDLVYDLNEQNRTAVVLGMNGGGSIDILDHSIADWNKLPAEYVFEARCPEDAVLLGLKSVKVYADPTYINILVEPNMEEVVDLEYVPFHIFINTDNSDATGGYSDEFSDANTDILLEGALFASDEPYNYNPFVFKWWGEVGGSGWGWTDWSVEHSESDCWGAIVCEGDLADCGSQYVDGKFEIKINRKNIPATWSDTQFGIGFDIQQSWSSVGILPIASPTDEKTNGKADKLKVRIHSSGVASNTDITELTIPATVSHDGKNYSVTSIGNGAFKENQNLTSVTIGNNVTVIGEEAFIHCSYLKTLTLGNSVADIQYAAFAHCNNISSLTLPNSVTSIGGYAFYHCNNASSLTLGNKVTSIDEAAFYHCYNLTTLTIPNSVTHIGDYAFGYCQNLTSVTIPSSVNDDCDWRITHPLLTKVEAPAWFFDVYEGYWVSCPKELESVTINSGELTEDAFQLIKRSYKTLKALDISDVTNAEFADEAFKGCYSLESLVLPTSLKKIGYMLAAGCIHLKEFTIPASVTEIGERAFEDCRSLAKITFARNTQLQRISNWAFYNCHGLQSIAIPEGVTEIGDGAFYGCVYLTNISVPASVRSIGDYGFALCSKLKKMLVAADVPPTITAKTFEDVSREIPVYVPMESAENYKTDPYWGELNIIGSYTAVENVESDPAATTKQLRDGQLFILRGDKTYTIQGQEVK